MSPRIVPCLASGPMTISGPRDTMPSPARLNHTWELGLKAAPRQLHALGVGGSS